MITAEELEMFIDDLIGCGSDSCPVIFDGGASGDS